MVNGVRDECWLVIGEWFGWSVGLEDVIFLFLDLVVKKY